MHRPAASGVPHSSRWTRRRPDSSRPEVTGVHQRPSCPRPGGHTRRGGAGLQGCLPTDSARYGSVPYARLPVSGSQCTPPTHLVVRMCRSSGSVASHSKLERKARRRQSAGETPGSGVERRSKTGRLPDPRHPPGRILHVGIYETLVECVGPVQHVEQAGRRTNPYTVHAGSVVDVQVQATVERLSIVFRARQVQPLRIAPRTLGHVVVIGAAKGPTSAPLLRCRDLNRPSRIDRDLAIEHEPVRIVPGRGHGVSAESTGIRPLRPAPVVAERYVEGVDLVREVESNAVAGSAPGGDEGTLCNLLGWNVCLNGIRECWVIDA